MRVVSYAFNQTFSMSFTHWLEYHFTRNFSSVYLVPYHGFMGSVEGGRNSSVFKGEDPSPV